jgi:hypothetical protein
MKRMASDMLRSVMDEGDERPNKTKRAEQRGAARFYANVRIDANLLASRAEKHCIEAVLKQQEVLIAHDSSEFDEHGRNEPHDAGPLRSSESRGYMVHSGAILDPTCAARVGFVYLRAWTRPYPQGTPRPEGHQGVGRVWKNEDDKWFWGIERSEKALGKHGFTGEVRHVADHEGSSFASMAKATRRRRLYTARTESDRCIHEGEGKLFDYLKSRPVVEHGLVNVEEDPKSAAHGSTRRRRTAKVELRYARVTLQATCNYTGRRYRKGLKLWAVHVYEPDPPKGCEPLEWMLLTTLVVASRDDALLIVADYRCRWGAEDMYKIIKSACHAEMTTVPNLAAFKRLLAVVWPVATHIARWTYAARVDPKEPALLHLGAEALEMLKEACRFHKLPLPRRAWTIRDVVIFLAQMGGHELRKDREPGWKVIWRGWRVFCNFWDHYRHITRGRPPPSSHPLRRPAASAPSMSG